MGEKDRADYQGGETTGFQSPAQDHIEHVLDLAEVLDLRKPGMYPCGSSARPFWNAVFGTAIFDDYILHAGGSTIALARRTGAMGLAKAAGDFFRELLDTPGRIFTLSAIVVALGGGTSVTAIAQMFFHVHGLFLIAVGLLSCGLLILVAAVYVSKHPLPDTQATVSPPVQELAVRPGVPASGANIDLNRVLRLAYVSQLTEQTERDITIAVAEQFPSEREATLAKFIGIQFWASMHENTWRLIYRSQIEALDELNANGGLMPIANCQAHYERAAKENPDTYSADSFQRWLAFIINQGLLIRHPSDMIEITVRGRDFLKYMTHIGWNATMRRF